MKYVQSVALLLVLLVGVAVVEAGWFSSDEDDSHTHEHDAYQFVDEEMMYVTFGSVIKLVHRETGYRLHSHEVNYGGGSKQQSVTAYPLGTDVNSYWIVKEAMGAEPKQQGTPLSHGTAFRLQHMMTGKNLHSHRHSAPLSSGGFEVSCFKGEDSGDNWILDVPGKGDWKRGENVRLKHADMSTYLFSHNRQYGSPISGQNEVKAVTKRSADVYWYTEEGLYFESNAPTDTVVVEAD